MKFRVARGRHSEGGVTYLRGDVVDSKSDLNRMNQPGCIKFIQVDKSVPAKSTHQEAKEREANEAKVSQDATDDEDEVVSVEELEAQYKKLTVPELTSYAEEEEIDISAAKNKSEIISAIVNAETEEVE